ncbi:Shedu anti-phage system protein SduA domain-containing protein [Allonocardiopsis opalescens]|uniref:Uncharacterized protein DUF4263 n=1 Tax=Allonocardiopsis opalescens TaxID=1144618 RepID=A0A2T0PYW6_9ACTN|nr:Shedu anti-phage system protein SduA domain-containing protein [Allonocardiopsis opalescens]PRX96597.1 uncharacterized protein DUF4263 [Allonocardiopsis opalescens]
MAVRADFSLELQLEAARKEAVDESTRAAISDALAHMSQGSGGKRRGGKALVQLLVRARLQAADLDEWHVVRILQDSLDYAEGRILQPDFDERYRLFQEGAVRNSIRRDAVAATMRHTYQYVLDTVHMLRIEEPGLTLDDLLTHVSDLIADADFLDAPEDRPGRYRIVRGRAELSLWLERVLRSQIDIEQPAEAARRIAMSPDALNVLANDTDGQTLLRAAELQRRSAGLAALRKAAEDRDASEHDLQRALSGQHWIFGGRFIDESEHRRLVPGDEVDIPLIRGDGSLHIVELKRAMGLSGKLVKRHRNAWVPTAEVHDAVAQAVNYLVGLDEERQRIRDEFDLETRRASAVVLIGHPDLQADVPETEINEALRVFNTHINRVEVLTYKELIDNAERALGDPRTGSIRTGTTARRGATSGPG